MVSDPVGLASIQKRKWLAELTELKSIFSDCLPIGECTEETEAYFNRLQEVICNHDYTRGEPLQREDFDHDDPDVQYSYLSDALSQKQSSRRELRAITQEVDCVSHVDQGEVPQPGGEVSADPTSIPEREGDGDTEDWLADSNNPGW